MIQAFEPGEGESTLWTGPRLVIYLNLLGLQTPNEDEGTPPLKPAMQNRVIFFKSKFNDFLPRPFSSRNKKDDEIPYRLGKTEELWQAESGFMNPDGSTTMA